MYWTIVALFLVAAQDSQPTLTVAEKEQLRLLMLENREGRDYAVSQIEGKIRFHEKELKQGPPTKMAKENRAKWERDCRAKIVVLRDELKRKKTEILPIRWLTIGKKNSAGWFTFEKARVVDVQGDDAVIRHERKEYLIVGAKLKPEDKNSNVTLKKVPGIFKGPQKVSTDGGNRTIQAIEVISQAVVDEYESQISK